MVSAEDIRRRVEDADRAHIARRADAAANVGAALDDLDAAERAVEAAHASVAGAIAEATSIMTLAELAKFTGASVSKLTASKTRRRTKPRRSKASEPAAAAASPQDD